MDEPCDNVVVHVFRRRGHEENSGDEFELRPVWRVR
jgi:hypothetical protein